MSEDLGSASGIVLKQASDDEVITWVKDAINASHEDARKGDDGAPSSTGVAELQQNGVTVDLTHKNIVTLPEEAIEVMKIEIERLAISHNRIMHFPLKMAECHRLRYLNVRYNALKEVPKAILQLESLEILDLSRNRIKHLPEEIGNLTSLKVLAISRNRIERLPFRLSQINSLQLIKFDDNPLVFPPPESYAIDPTSGKIAVNEMDQEITRKIKKALYKANKRAPSSKDLDTEFDPAKTPRPAPRKGSGRYPVKASRDDFEQAVTSPPDAPPVPSIPSKHQVPHLPIRSMNRQNRGLTASSDAPILWSPNQSTDRLFGGEYSAPLSGSTLHSSHRSHAIITPRLLPGSGKLADPLHLMTSPDGSEGSGTTAILMGQGGNVVTQFQPNVAKSIDSSKIISLWNRAISHCSKAIVLFIKMAEFMRGSVTGMPLNEVQTMRINTLLYSLNASLKVLEERRGLLSHAKTPKQMNLVGRAISSSLAQAYDLIGTSKPLTIDTVAKVVADDMITRLVSATLVNGDNTDIASSMMAAQYQTLSARINMSQAKTMLPTEFFQRSDSSAYGVAARRPGAPIVPSINTVLPSLGPPTLNTAVSLAVRPVQSATQSPVGMSASSSFADFSTSMNFASSPTASEPSLGIWNNRLATDSEDTRRAEVQDAQYNRLLALLNRVVQACLSPEFSALKFLGDCMHDKDQDVRNNSNGSGNSQQAQRMWHDTAMALTHTLASVEKVVEYLPLAQTAKEFNEALELQEYIRCMISFWGDFCTTVNQIRRANLWKGMPTMIPKYMQMIHLPMKEFSKFVKGSANWIHLAMDTSVLQQGRETPATQYGGSQFGGVLELATPAVETPNGERYPSTPLGAALGPAAAAAMARPNAAFMSRYDQYASSTNRRY